MRDVALTVNTPGRRNVGKNQKREKKKMRRKGKEAEERVQTERITLALYLSLERAIKVLCSPSGFRALLFTTVKWIPPGFFNFIIATSMDLVLANVQKKSS